jgi:uncharacterized lipoprotein YddW (UPF0748 family)
MKRILSFLTATLLLASCGVLTPTGRDIDKNYSFNQATDRITLQHEVRGDWLTTVGGSDWPDKNDPAETQIIKLRTLIRNLKEAGCNLVYFQVVSNMDALFKTHTLPWSHVLTGVQGQDPGYDPLWVAIEACREQGLEIHAWINPLRAGNVTLERCPEHVVLSHPDWIQQYGNGYYLDPALPEVQQHLYNLVTELMTNYDLDGIHIDDYFYPDGIQADEKQWTEKNLPEGVDREEWRYNNIDLCVKAMYDATHAAKPNATFGISPAGRLENTLKLYADPRRWVKQKTVDYLVPQIYWPHGHRIADFKKVLDSWEDIVKDVPMFTGLAPYRKGQTGFESMAEYERQVQECREAPYVQGHIWFRTVHILDDDFLPTLKNSIYAYGSLVPKIGTSDRTAPARPSVTLTGHRIQWAEVEGAEGYAVYELSRQAPNDTRWTANLVYQGPHISYDGKVRTNYVVLAYSGKEKSDLSEVIFIPSK